MNEQNVKRVVALAIAVGCLRRCQEAGNAEWSTKHANAIMDLMDNAPSGSGIDHGTQLLDESTGEHLQFSVDYHHMDYHHMDDGGYYDGWTEHVLHVTPSFEVGFNLKITGPNRNDIKDYLSDVYHSWLGEDVPQWTGYERVEADKAS